MKMGPIWDFDWSAIGPSTGKHRNEYADKIAGLRSINNWFDLMLRGSPEFKALVGVRFDEVKETLLGVISDAREEEALLNPYYERNHLRWHWFRIFDNRAKYYKDVLDWCEARIEWLDTAV